MQMRGKTGENQGMAKETEREAQEVEVSGDALVIAEALERVADAIDRFTRAFTAGDEVGDSEATPEYDLSGRRIV